MSRKGRLKTTERLRKVGELNGSLGFPDHEGYACLCDCLLCAGYRGADQNTVRIIKKERRKMDVALYVIIALSALALVEGVLSMADKIPWLWRWIHK